MSNEAKLRPRDLRIGCLVYDRGGKILRIDWFEHDRLCMANPVYVEPDEYFAPDGKMFGHPYTEDMEFAKPIPLTKEWLLKFGFRKVIQVQEEWDESIKDDASGLKSKKTFFFIDFSFGRIEIVTYGDSYVPYVYLNDKCLEIKYVHQLQNLYHSLTGEELSIAEKMM